MKRLSRIVVTVVASVGIAALAAAGTPSNVLNKIELQKLVAAEAPIAHLRLVAHFNGVAEMYFAEAAQHRDRAVVYRANANRSSTTTAADDCIRLAERARTWAIRARELARYHIARATGREAALPVGATALHSGFGAAEPGPADLHRLALTARTRGDHLVLREYYSTLARRRAAEADRYSAAANALHATVRNGSYDPAASYERLARIARRAARDAMLAADRHAIFATVG